MNVGELVRRLPTWHDAREERDWAELARRALPGAVLVAVFLLALRFRLEDALSSPIVGAEDPYTHMVIVKELAENGYFSGSRHLDYPLYPPGLHTLVFMVWSVSGVELFDIVRFLPPLIGAAGVLALAAFLNDEAGPVAAAVGGALAATMSEHVLRTNLLFPTTLDLLLIPAFLFGIARLTRGQSAAAVVVLATGTALMVTHPWATLLFAPITIAAVVAGLVLPSREAPRIAHRAAAALIAAVIGVVSFWWWRDAEFISISSLTGGADHAPSAIADAVGVPPAALAGAAVVGIAGVVGLGVASWRARRMPRRMRAIRVGASVALTVAALAVVPRLTENPPLYVDYDAMIGAPAIILALVGVAFAPLRPSFAAYAGLAICAVTFPASALDVYGHPIWPHRAVAFLTIGVALLAGVAASGIADGLGNVSQRSGYSRPRVRAAIGGVIAVAVVLSAAPVGHGAYTWYRYYDDEQWVVMDEALARMESDPQAVMLVSSWQPNLFLRAMGDADRVVWVPYVYEQPADRDALLSRLHAEGKHPYYVEDHHTYRERGVDGWEGYQLEGAPLEKVVTCCDGRGALYEHRG